MPNFITQVDFSTQIKQYQNTEGSLSGSVNINQYTILGTDYIDLPLGLDSTTTGITATYSPIINGYFTGTTGSTTFYFNDPNMDIAGPNFSAITASNSGLTQYADAFQPIYTTIVDGNSFDVYYSGVSFDMTPVNLDEYIPGEFSGATFTNTLNYVSGSTYAWWFLKSGSTTWNEIKGRLQTDRITITESASTGYVLTCLDSNGHAVWLPTSSIIFTGGTGSCITDLYLTNVHGCSPINIQPTSPDDVYIVNGGGNVGIGVTSATTKLHISGDTIINSDYLMLSDTLTTIPALNFKGFVNVQDSDNSIGYFGFNLNTSGETGLFIYNNSVVGGGIQTFGSNHIRNGGPHIVGSDFYRNKVLISANNSSDGMIIKPKSDDPSATLWFEMDTASVMILKGDGVPSSGNAFLGIALNPDGTEMPSSNFQIGGTGTTGTFKYIDGNQQNGYVLTSDANGNATWQASTSGGMFTGNTSASCITDLYVTNVHGCSPITVWDSVQSNGSQSTGATSFAFGSNTSALGDYSHAEGRTTMAIGLYSHAEGSSSQSIGEASHAEGQATIAIGQASHSEGVSTTAQGIYSHAEGNSSISIGAQSHTEGNSTIASGTSSHAEGYLTTSQGDYSHVEGWSNTSSGTSSHAEGYLTTSQGNYSHAEGYFTKSIGLASHSEGTQTTSQGDYSHSEGFSTKSLGDTSHSEGFQTTASGDRSHAEGSQTIASNFYSHSEGFLTNSLGIASHSEGQGSTASGGASHAEGLNTTASGSYSHSEGNETRAIGDSSHAEGYQTTSSGYTSHSGGYQTKAIGDYSFVHGLNSVANVSSTIVLGNNITGNTSNYTYVDGLNIKTVGAGPSTIDIGVDANGFVVNVASDISLKENIEVINSALDKIKNLRGVYYTWKDKESGGSDRKIGFIAQEVEPIVPELVYTHNDGLKVVQYKDVTALLVEAVKELSTGISINATSVPLNASDPIGEIGSISYDDNFLYVKTAKNGGLWGRVSLDTSW